MLSSQHIPFLEHNNVACPTEGVYVYGEHWDKGITQYSSTVYRGDMG